MPQMGRKDDHGGGREAPSGVDQCWDKDGSILPLSLTDMTEEEREVGSRPLPAVATEANLCFLA
jgi:hypothetical protein